MAPRGGCVRIIFTHFPLRLLFYLLRGKWGSYLKYGTVSITFSQIQLKVAGGYIGILSVRLEIFEIFEITAYLVAA